MDLGGSKGTKKIRKGKNMTNREKEFIKTLKESHRKSTVKIVRELFVACSDMVNSFSRPDVEVIEEIRKDKFLTEQMNQISWYWIRTAATNASTNFMYDERNEQALKTCLQLFLTPKGTEVVTKNTEDFKEEDLFGKISKYENNRCDMGYLFAIMMSTEHRTIQQSFTGFVFTYLTKTNKDFCKITKEAGRDELGYMWMI
jgi:hypothetical protein